jgi:hypothetical protein
MSRRESKMSVTSGPTASLFGVAVILLSNPAETPAAGPGPEAPSKATESEMVLREEGAELPSLTVTGENRIRIEFDRPTLEFDLDPRTAPGLEWGDPLAVLQGERIDLETPFLAESATAEIPSLADPWANGFRAGPVARFRPQLEGVAEWRLVIASSLSDTVAVFSGSGEPPEEIEWDGRKTGGGLSSPALVYSYSVEVADRAGNRRTFVGPGFRLPAYRATESGSHVLLLNGEQLPSDWMRRAPETIPPLLQEAASLANRGSETDAPVEVRVAAPTFARAEDIARSVAACLSTRLLGNPLRLRTVAEAVTGAPEAGDIVIVFPE